MGIHIVGTYVQGTPVCTFALSPINYCMTINILLLLSLLRIVLYRLMLCEHIYTTGSVQGSIPKYVLINPASIIYALTH